MSHSSQTANALNIKFF